jgi:hypothetical protein
MMMLVAAIRARIVFAFLMFALSAQPDADGLIPVLGVL